jgi:pimeloyl-ACP methyl ester carboxylesterase
LIPTAPLATLFGFLLVLHGIPAAAAIDPPAESPIGGEAVRFDSADGVHLIGHYWKAAAGTKAEGGILFVHEPFRSSRDWAYMAERMANRGFACLVFDLRGHGESLTRGADEQLDREIFGPEDFQAMEQDVAAALAFLRQKSGLVDSVHVAGSDLGGSLAMLAAIGDPAIRSVALLSPGLGYDGINLIGKAAYLGNRPLLLVYSVEDGYSRKTVEVMSEEATGPMHTEAYYGVGHGTKMLAREPALEQLLQAWFLGTVITAEGRALDDTGKPLTGEKEMEPQALDTDAERKRLEEQRKKDAAQKAGAVGDDEDENRKFKIEDGKK